MHRWLVLIATVAPLSGGAAAQQPAPSAFMEPVYDAQIGTFDSQMKWAACFTPNPVCDQRLGTIHTRIRSNGLDSEEVGRALP